MSNIAVGSGYSSDTQQIASNICFNAQISSISGSSSYVKLDTAMSFEDIQSDIKIDVTTNGEYGMFSASAGANYMRATEDQYYSLSLNYYQYAEQGISMDVPYGTDSLNEVGQGYYQNGANPYFGLSCGDNYIKSYQQGAMLVMSLNIEFTSEYEKDQFNEYASGSFGDVVSASEEIQTISTSYSIAGSVSIQAFQMGGDPSQLSHILNPDPSGNYYALSCSLQDMTSCVAAASGLLDYARNDFSTQFSFENSTGLTALGIGFAEYEPIYKLGLNTPESFVTERVIQDREFLGNSLKENQYYIGKLYSLTNGYIVPWANPSPVLLEAQALLDQAQNNIKVLLSPSNPEQGGLGCYDLPDQCNTITKQIQTQLQPITQDDLGFLEQIKYYMPITGGTLYNNGGSPSTDSWGGIPAPTSSYDVLETVNSASFTTTQASYDITFSAEGHNDWHGWYQDSAAIDVGYIGTFCDQRDGDTIHYFSDTIIAKQLSEFYFEALNPTTLAPTSIPTPVPTVHSDESHSESWVAPVIITASVASVALIGAISYCLYHKHNKVEETSTLLNVNS